ncbi:hypothetical protein SPE26_29965 [Bacillus thuringiensis]|jgi:two-component SAPR family response regulator|uniref:Uncharacterized protein n=1 Tax=Bacillus thuringiensis TaxID=1428 RepID=A0AAW9GI77_BACTU|nr:MULTISPECIES: hypothetical protein [Bacillus cereus group]HDR8497100.1 hypothetical protein [Bacillus cereus]MDY0854989.1 hypothetical protein [Bacillus thuringiensis]MDY4394877.1 hypothetical protein [Bacillus thuringiensis]GIX59458.1 hypothetical protein BPADB04_44880 [Bacillus paranthracis]HDR8508743.1 hypothetical protein [Bacillus cereus]
MNIREINDKFFKEMIEQYNKNGDDENARECKEFYKMLKAQRQGLDEDNKHIISELIK